MGSDYYKLYKVLQAHRNARAAAEAKVKQISHAYEVLKDPLKRAVYDQYFEEGLKSGVYWRRSPAFVFSDVFGSEAGETQGSEDVFSASFSSGAGLYGCEGSVDGMFRSFRMGDDVQSKAAPIEKTLLCSLEDLCNATTKKMKISREVVGASGRNEGEEVLTIDIKPGWKKGTKITFEEKGNDVDRDVITADIVFTIDEMPHELFKRDGNDLIVTRKVSLAEALTGSTQLTMLDGSDLTVHVDSINSLTNEVVVEGEGMPIQNEPSKKGNLIVEFDIKFPKLQSREPASNSCSNVHKCWWSLSLSISKVVKLFLVYYAVFCAVFNLCSSTWVSTI